MRVTLVLQIAVLTVALTACGQDDNAPTALHRSESLRRAIDSIAKSERIPGVVVAVRTADGRSFDIISGVASLATRRPIAAEDRFRIASVTKAIVATVVLQLVDEGSLTLDASRGSLLPGIVPAADRITVQQLLNHMAGLPDHTNDEAFIESVYADPGRTWTPQELIAIANRGVPSFEPGAPLPAISCAPPSPLSRWSWTRLTSRASTARPSCASIASANCVCSRVSMSERC